MTATTITASDFYTLFSPPPECALRIFLREHAVSEREPSAFDLVLQRLGDKHEKSHLSTFDEWVDLSAGTAEQRIAETERAIEEGLQVIYQPLMKVAKDIDGMPVNFVGSPDFLILEGKGYTIRDSKLAKRITEDDHAEILRGLEFYGWLFEQSFAKPLIQLQVHSGDNQIVNIPYDSGNGALQVAGKIIALKRSKAEPYSSVGWTKCSNCVFRDYCWTRAERIEDLAIVEGIDQGLAASLHQEGIQTISQFLDHFDEESLSEYKRPWGQKQQRVGKSSKRILLSAKAMLSDTEIPLTCNPVLEEPIYVMFDLEGLPPYQDELEKIYLWGLQVFGDAQSDYLYALADFGEDGDRTGWKRFLELATQVFTAYGDIRFVHYSHYEKTKIKMYKERYGDPGNVAQRVEDNLLDLLPIVKNSIILPLPSYSLKVIEQHVGFKRTQSEYGGDWAMAKYIEATETSDDKMRKEVIEKILVYNKEDLEATWAVCQWLTRASRKWSS
jgi:predicted RecB family nuclease